MNLTMCWQESTGAPGTENPEEVEAVRWVKMKDLMSDIQENPEHYTPWFMIALKEVMEYVNKKLQAGKDSI